MRVERVLGRAGGWPLVGALVVASWLLRWLLARGFAAPWIVPDETYYALTGRSLWQHGSFALLGDPVGVSAPLYPALVGLPLALAGPATGIAVIQLVQALAMSAAAAIVYAWGRTIVGNSWALVAAALTVAVPALAYSGLLMSEALFYPVICLTLWALARALVSPTAQAQVWLLAGITFSVATRLQALGLIPAVFVAVSLMCVSTRSWLPARRLVPTGVALVLVPSGLAASAAVRGSWKDLLGTYSAAVGGYDLSSALATIAWHTAGVFVVVAGVPLVALVLLAVRFARVGERDPGAAALVAVATAWTLVATVEVGVFASEWVGHIAERDLITVAPPIFLAFTLWVSRGAPRDLIGIIAAVGMVVVPAVFLPISRFATPESALDAFATLPLTRLGEHTSNTVLELVYLTAVLGLAALAFSSIGKRRLATLSVVAVGLLLAASTLFSSHEIKRLSRADDTWVFGGTARDWIDGSTGDPVTFLASDSGVPAVTWKHVFWNERIDTVITTPEAAGVPPLDPQTVEIKPDGNFRTEADAPLLAAALVAPRGLDVDGERIAETGRIADLAGLALSRPRNPLTAQQHTVGLKPDGSFSGPISITAFACSGGTLELTLLGKTKSTLTIERNGQALDTVALRNGDLLNVDLPGLPPGPAGIECIYVLDSPGLVGTSRIAFTH